MTISAVATISKRACFITGRGNIFYCRPKAKSTDWMKSEADLVDRVEAICLEFPRYGYRRVTKQLQREGWVVNH